MFIKYSFFIFIFDVFYFLCLMFLNIKVFDNLFDLLIRFFFIYLNYISLCYKLLY